MNSEELKIGRIPYANFFPIFYYFDRERRDPAYKFVKGVPSKLNRMLREGELDISPSSSIEFLRNRSKYRILPWFSISSSGPVNSILLFSKYPIHELDGKDIALSSESETSTALLKIILAEFLSIKCRFETVHRRSVRQILSSFSAVLHIGDTAMREAKKQEARSKGQGARDKGLWFRGQGAGRRALYIYDLGELWFKYTGLPFVFALWIVRKNSVSEKVGLVEKFSSDMIRAKKYARKRFPLIAGEAPQKKWLSEEELVAYWKIISYDFTEKHLQGLNLFEQYVKKLKRQGRLPG